MSNSAISHIQFSGQGSSSISAAGTECFQLFKYWREFFRNLLVRYCVTRFPYIDILNLLFLLINRPSWNPKECDKFTHLFCPTVMNPCGRHNGGCQHICVLSHRTDNDGLGFRCKCRHGYDLQDDHRTCFSEFTSTEGKMTLAFYWVCTFFSSFLWTHSTEGQYVFKGGLQAMKCTIWCILFI